MLSESLRSYQEKKAKSDLYKTGIPTIDANGGITGVTELVDVVYPYRVASGKTALALTILGYRARETGKPGLYIDLEYSINSRVLLTCSVNPDDIIVSTTSDAMVLEQLIDSVSIVVVDSVATADNVMEIIKVCYLHEVSVILITQLRGFMGKVYSPQEYKFARIPRTTIQLSSVASIRRATETIGRKLNVLVSNRYKRYEFPLVFSFTKGYNLRLDAVRNKKLVEVSKR